MAGDRFEAFSAGTTPRPVHRLVVLAMQESSIDISGQVSKGLDRYLGESFDLIITVCDRAKEHCPIFPGDPERIHWGFDDPAEAVGTEEERMRVFRRVRNEIATQIRLLVSLRIYAP